LIFIPLDLSDKDSIKEFADRVKEQVDKVDILINNAGVMAIPERRVTANGFEMQMGTNHFGHFYLTHLLWDKIKKSEAFRIINVSSLGHKGLRFPRFNLKIDFEDINYTKGYDPELAYGRSKAANILFTR
jgi:NAD(P)-dependent dehydrogenase (short-subunit alcohol dehydrogenase family)